ncbi:hypothetical protein Tco_0289524 [Tanacetum coccineum]
MQKAILLHFVEQGDDTFYVTGYDNDGLKCGGYNVVRKRPGRIVSRVWPYQDYPHMLPTDFLFGLDQNAPLSIVANRINHDIHVQLVEIGEQTGVFKYQLNEDDWNALVEAVGLEWGMLVVFTRTNLNTLGLMAFHTCGKQETMSKFDGVINLKKRKHGMTLDEKADERMEHICLRPDKEKSGAGIFCKLSGLSDMVMYYVKLVDLYGKNLR